MKQIANVFRENDVAMVISCAPEEFHACRGANLVRDIEWVIFDEVHYISDDDRGIVYEEVIIMLPPHVNIVMLSATVPNKVDFADWVGGIRQKRMHICGTNKRPVPLQHNIYFNKKLYPVCTGKTFDYKAYNIAKASFKCALPTHWYCRPSAVLHQSAMRMTVGLYKWPLCCSEMRHLQRVALRKVGVAAQLAAVRLEVTVAAVAEVTINPQPNRSLDVLLLSTNVARAAGVGEGVVRSSSGQN